MNADLYRQLVGQRVRAARTKSYATQKAFAKAIGIDPAQVSRIETGQRYVDAMLLRRIADELSVAVDELLPPL